MRSRFLQKLRLDPVTSATVLWHKQKLISGHEIRTQRAVAITLQQCNVRLVLSTAVFHEEGTAVTAAVNQFLQSSQFITVGKRPLNISVLLKFCYNELHKGRLMHQNTFWAPFSLG